MWVSKKKWDALEKRIANLEGQFQGQPETKIDVKAIRENLQKYEARCGSVVRDAMS